MYAMRARFFALTLLALLLAAPGAQAGRSCEPHKLTAGTLASGLAMAEKTLRALDASGERVVL